MTHLSKNTLFFLSIILILLNTLGVQAQQQRSINVLVIDGFLELPLPDAKVVLLNSDSTKIEDISLMKFTDADDHVSAVVAAMRLTPGENYILHGTLDGYDDAWLDINVPKVINGAFSPGALKFFLKQKKTLNEIVVTATKVKMFWKGDTIVYNADAFNLPNGSMLDDLIRQMPGATMNDDGEIFVNGRKIDELLLGSRSFFRGKSQVLLQNLPYYTISNIKVYDKETDLSKAAGYEIEPKKYVMDVNLKQDYKSGAIANVEAGAGTADRYLARAFLLGFSDPYRFSVVGNLNNVNESRHIGQNDSWTPDKTPTSMLTTRSVATELNYKKNNLDETLTADFSYQSNGVTMRQNRELFLDGLNPKSMLLSQSHDRDKKLTLHNRLFISKPYIDLNLEYTHRTFSHRSNSTTEQSENSIITNLLDDMDLGNGCTNQIDTRIFGMIFPGKILRSTLTYMASFKLSDEGNNNRTRYDFITPEQAPLFNISKYHNHTTSEAIWIRYSPFKISGIAFIIDENTWLEQNKKHDYLYHPDTLLLPSQSEALKAITDFANSYNSRLTRENYITKVIFNKTHYLEKSELKPYPYAYFPWELTIGISPKLQSLFYNRGELDTHVTSNILAIELELRIKWFPNNKYERQFEFYAKHSSNDVSLYDRIDYRDTSKPLVVKLGNTKLKGDRITEAQADFYNRGHGEDMIHACSSFIFFHRATAQSVIYAPDTGTYTYRPINVYGNWLAKAGLDLNKSLDTKRHWTFNNNLEGLFNHNIDHTMTKGQTSSELNKVNTLTLHERVVVQYEYNRLNLRIIGDVNWRRSTGKMYDFSTLSVVDYNYGMSIRYTIPGSNTTISGEGTMYSRRGYGSSSLNSNDFIFNASLSQPMLKGKLVAKIETFDILHQMSQTQYEVNAQGRIETWYRSLPHYVMLHVIYNINLNPGKK